MNARYPPAGEAHVYIVDLDSHEPAFLDESEKERARRFHRPEDARRFAAAHGALRRVLASYLGTGRFRYVYGPFGKPRLEPNVGLYFNLSHSGSMGAIAVANVETGIDIERIRDEVPVDGLLPMVLSPMEREATLTIGSFYRLWVRKEAFLKATGEGLNVPLDRVPAYGPQKGGMSMFDIEVAPGYAGALAAMGEISVVRTFSSLPASALNKLINDVVIRCEHD